MVQNVVSKLTIATVLNKFTLMSSNYILGDISLETIEDVFTSGKEMTLERLDGITFGECKTPLAEVGLQKTEATYQTVRYLDLPDLDVKIRVTTIKFKTIKTLTKKRDGSFSFVGMDVEEDYSESYGQSTTRYTSVEYKISVNRDQIATYEVVSRTGGRYP